MDQALKDDLLERFRAHLDTLDDGEQGDEGVDETEPAADLYALYVELAALRTEVRTESRLVKDALDLFRGVVDRGAADHDAALREIERLRGDAQAREQALLRPLLGDLLDLRDRLAAGLTTPPAPPVRRWWGGTVAAADESWREGLRISLARLDRLLRDRDVTAVDVLGQPFDPRLARAVATTSIAGQANGVVVDEIRPGFLWNGVVLRPAEVVVNKTIQD